MKKNLSRKEELELILKAIDLPVLVISIQEYGKWWNPSQYSELKKLVLKELYELGI